MKNFILRYKKIIFPSVTLLVTLGITFVGAEIALRFLEKRFMQVAGDLNKVVSSEIRAGGLLKKNVNEYVIDSFGNKILWVNNADGFRSEKEYSRKPDINTFRILSLGNL